MSGGGSGKGGKGSSKVRSRLYGILFSRVAR